MLAFGLLAGMWNVHNFGAVAVCLSIGSIEPHVYARHGTLIPGIRRFATF